MVTQVHPSEMARQMASDFGWLVLSPDGPERPASMQRRYATVWLPPDGQVACRQVITEIDLKAIHMEFRIAPMAGGLAFLTIDGCKMTT